MLETDGFLRPYFGGGVAAIWADSDVVDEFGLGVTDDDIGIGFWASLGLMWTLDDCINVGLDVRYSHADVTLFDADVDAGGTHAGLIFGFAW